MYLLPATDFIGSSPPPPPYRFHWVMEHLVTLFYSDLMMNKLISDEVINPETCDGDGEWFIPESFLGLYFGLLNCQFWIILGHWAASLFLKGKYSLCLLINNDCSLVCNESKTHFAQCTVMSTLQSTLGHLTKDSQTVTWFQVMQGKSLREV